MRYLREVLEKCGVSLPEDEGTTYVLTQEQSLVIRDIDKYLEKNSKNNNVNNFVKDLKVLFENQDSFRSALLPTLLKKDGVGDAIKINQESLVRILLNVDSLQSEVMGILIEEITRCASENNEDDASFLRLCLNALRYLPYIKNAEKITQEILDILDISTFESQLEMLNLIPAIIPDAQCDKTAKELCKLMSSSSELTPAIVDCLTCLNLSAESKLEVESCLVEELNDFNGIKNIPILYEFLTKNCSKQTLNMMLEKCRNSLGDILLSSDSDAESQKVIIISKVNTSVFAKIIYEGYVNFLTRVREHKPIDLLLFIILHSAVSNKKQRIEVLFKRRVKTDILKVNHLTGFYEQYLTKSLIKNYLNSIIELASCLLKDNETIEFATTMYKLTFDSKIVHNMHRQDVIHNLIVLVGFWEIKNISQIIRVLMKLSENRETMKQYASQLMLLLDKIDVCELGDVKDILDILCSLVCKDENYSGLKNELHILIRKQLSTSKILLRQHGIIGALVMIKHNSVMLESQDDTFLQESIKLLEMAEKACEKSPDLMGLFYDQLANIVSSNELDDSFLKWLYIKVTNDFQDKYVTETIPSSSSPNVEFSMQYSLNSIDEVDSDIYINIGELTIKKNSVHSIKILAPFFRLLRLLHFKENNGDLSTIDALLGCGIILPKIECLDLFSLDELKDVADSLYHCVNWFREVISAFVTQQQKKIRRKVLLRLENLVAVEKCLGEVIAEIPEHKLPSSYYLTDNLEVSSKNTNVKRPKKKQKLDDTAQMSINETTARAGPSKKSAKKAQLKVVYNFRDLDTDVMILLKYPLKLHTGDLEEMSQQTQQTTIDVLSFNFLLEDLAVKLQTLTKNIRIVSLLNIAKVKPEDVIKDFVKLSPNIYNKFRVILKRMKVMLEESDGENIFTPEANELKATFCSFLNCLNLVFNWNGFRDLKNLRLLMDCLKVFKATVLCSRMQSTNQLSNEFASELSEYTEQCLNLTSGVNLIKILQGLCVIVSNNTEIKKKIASASCKLLSRPWYDFRGNLENGKDYFMQLDILIRSYLDGANVKTLGGLIATLQNEAGTLKTKEDSLEMLKSINKASFHVLYRNFCICLLERIKVEINSLTNAEHLNLWKTTALSLHGLMAILKVQESHSNLVHFLKKSVGVLRVFLSHGMPIMEIVLRSKTDQVIEILKTLQTTTRFLHHLCCDSKVKKNSALISYIPQFRLTLETFIFRVKAMLVANDCSAAFWLGNLKNRDLHGEDILSQNSTSTDGNCDEELPPDESEDEDITDETQVTGESNQESASEVFD